ncbi:lipid asymmetry maintenance protein MlaB [Candidatus Gillettellia adelgis]
MSTALIYESQSKKLILRGVLDRDTLLPLWRQRDKLLVNKTEINVTHLKEVDPAGLACLIHLRAYQYQQGVELKISGTSSRLKKLMALYNLTTIMLGDAGTQHISLL